VKRGGTFTYGVDQSVVSFDSVNTQDNGSLWADMNIFDQLVRLNPSATKLEPDLAQSWTVQQGGRVMIFHLRHNARFSDGTPVTAADVKFTWDLVLNPKAVNNWTLQAVKSIQAVDPYTFKVVLKKPWAPFLNDITLWGASIWSKKAYLKEGKSFINHPVGSGPFAVAKFSPGGDVLLKRNPYYWERDACGNQYPYVDSVKLVYLPNDNTRLVKLEGGATDAMVDLPYNLINAVSQMPGLTAANTPQLGVYAIGLNQKKYAPFRDNKVFQAMNYAIDRNAIVRAVFFGHAKPALSPIDQGVNFWTPKYGYPYNLALAKKLMAASKYPHGFKATLIINAGSTVYQGISVIVQSELKQLGIQVSLQPLDPATAFATEQKETYQMVMGNGTSDNIDPNENMEFCCVSNGGADSGYTGWKDPAADALYVKSQSEMNPARRAQELDQWQKIVMKELPTIWLIYPTNSFAYRNNVHGFFVQNTAHWPLWVVWKS
jgi:peptide/nickel transport system substrate-binding protein